ncbi:hypothetical protein MRX96_020824 [Rhipicephalus microplus]
MTTSIKLEEADAQLVTWTKKGLDVIGKATLPIKCIEQDCKLPLLVVRNEGSTLLGRDWFKPLNITVTGIQSIAHIAEAFVEKFLDVLEHRKKSAPPDTTDPHFVSGEASSGDQIICARSCNASRWWAEIDCT